MKILAMYLPQFHRVKENDEWWGEGFTEWVTVKKANRLYDGHKQPNIPYNDNYYNLLEKSVFEWQADLVKKSGIDGVCIYHYWFEKGKQILEKPAELLLQWNDIELPFCFSWANETWARTWSNLTDKNVWASSFENTKGSKESGILLEQKYGGIDDWKSHFEYLLTFFKDSRYIKIDNKPVIAIHKANDMHCLENMVEVWNNLAISNGFSGIYVVGNALRGSQRESCDSIFVCQPGTAMQLCSSTEKNGVQCYDYDEVWKNILSQTMSEKATMGAFVGYDDTPRHGTFGSVIENGSPEKFEKYMRMLVEKNRKNGSDLMFINAWNEWGEGMYLEPDTENEQKYIEALSRIVLNKQQNDESYDKAVKSEDSVMYELFYKKQFQLDREKHLEKILDKWMKLRENEISLFSEYKNKKIIIYGYGLLGKHLIFDLKMDDIEPICIIDRNVNVDSEYTVLSPEEEWPKADLFVVSATFDYGYIYRRIKQRVSDAYIVSLEHMIFEKKVW